MLGGLLVLSVSPAAAWATVVERIVAVVDERAILLSDLRTRARPFLVQVHQNVPPGAQRSAAISQLYRTVLNQLVDEELEERAARESKLSVTAQEIEDAFERVAQQNKLSVADLIAEAQLNGMSISAYRDELRRQLLEAKLINLRLQGRIRVTEDEIRSAHRRLVLEEREKLQITPAWVLIPTGSQATDLRSQRALAETIAEQARRSDFSELARTYSIDSASKDKGGLLRRMLPSELPPKLAQLAIGLEVGQVAPPVRIGEHYAILKIVEREPSQMPTLEDSRQQLAEQVYVDKMGRAKRTWLQNLRRQRHVEIRL